MRWQGRERWNYLNETPIQTVYERWVTPYRQLWAGKLTQLKRQIERESRMPASAMTSTLERIELEIDIAASRHGVARTH